jgi:hypothetical protein
LLRRRASAFRFFDDVKHFEFPTTFRLPFGACFGGQQHMQPTLEAMLPRSLRCKPLARRSWR